MELLQTIFYVLGIIFMIVNLAILISIAMALLYLKKKADDIHQSIDEKLATVKQVTSEPSVLARGAGAIAANLLSFALSKMFHRR